MTTDSSKPKERNNALQRRAPVAYDATDILLAEETGTSLWPENGNGKTAPDLTYINNEAEEYKTKLNLLHNIGKKVASASQLARLVENITQMTQRALNASASSVLLLDDSEQELLFEVAQGEAGRRLRKVKVNAQSGIAGWVAHHGKPLIVNDVSKDERFNKSVDESTGFLTKSIICAPLIVHRKIIGVIEVLNKLDERNFSGHDLEALVSVASTAAMSIENVRLHQAVLDAYKGTIKALAAAIDAKDACTRGHSQRVTEYALMGAHSLSLSKEDMEVIEYAGILHDIGKIGIPDSTLTKPGALNAAEQEILSMHPLIGANMLKEISFLEKAREFILHHHERHDGKGYPDGLKGQAIPMGARLLAVADAFDAMTTERAYRASLSIDYAISELYRFSGKQFCPVAVDAFISGFTEFHFPDKR